MEYRIVNRLGQQFVEIRYKGSEWSNWLFKCSAKPKKYYIWVPELNIYRSNISYG